MPRDGATPVGAPRQGTVIWLTGLPASGKSTLAEILAGRLAAAGHDVEIIDADAARRVLTPHPTYSQPERDWLYEVLTFLAGLLARHRVTVLVAATAHRRAYRDRARATLPRFAEVFVRCPLDLCRTRDPKGLYARSRRGLTRTLPGEDAPYEEPLRPDAVADTSRQTPDETADDVLAQLRRAGFLWAAPGLANQSISPSVR
jgi:adenylylsulfate kinase